MLTFAYLQFNDPDPIFWAAVYSLVALLVFLYSIGWGKKIYFGILFSLLIVYFLLLTPSILEWIQAGMPSLASEMKASTPEIEDMRELGGVGICLIITYYYWRRSGK